MNITNVRAYYNRYKETDNYRMLLFRNGFGIQTSEFTEMQSYLHENFKHLTNAIFGEGTIIKGGGLKINEIKTLAKCESGMFVTEGFIINMVAKENIAILDVGVFELGIILTKNIITEAQDPGLRDPGVEGENVNNPGAARLQLIGEWGLSSDISDPETQVFYPVHKIVDGKIISKDESSLLLEDNPIVQMVETYDDAAHGNYVAKGLNVAFYVDDVGNEEHIMHIGAGTGHIRGKRRSFAERNPIRLRWGTDKTFINNEPISITGDGFYPLRDTPIANLHEVMGVANIVKSFSKGVSGGQDLLTPNPIVRVNEVRLGPTVYTAGVNYNIVGNEISWVSAQPQPTQGETYSVDFDYQTEITGTVTLNPERTEIYISGLKPGETAYVDYYKYIPRYDYIVLKKEGMFGIVEGQPNRENLLTKPTIPEGLPVALVLVEYGFEPIVQPAGTRSYQMADIETMNGMINSLNYAVGRISSSLDLMIQDPLSDKANMFVDSFHDDDLRDRGLEDNNAAISDGILTVPIDWKISRLRTGKKITLSFNKTNPEELKQTAYSKSRLINDLDYEPNNCEINILPKSFQWISQFSGTGVSPEIVNDPGAFIPTTIDDGGPVVISVTGGRFASMEEVEVYMDSIKVVGVFTADNEGKIDFTFEVPEGVRACRDNDDSISIDVFGVTSELEATDRFVATARYGKTAFNNIQGSLAQTRKSISANSARIGSLQRGVSQLGRGLNDIRTDVGNINTQVGKLSGQIAGIGQRVTTIERTPPPAPVIIDRTLTIRPVTVKRFSTFVRRTTVINRTTVIRPFRIRFGDPLAQTFTLNDSQFMASIRIYLEELPSNLDPNKNWVEVSINGTTVGIPDKENVHVQKRLWVEDLVVGWNEFNFEEPPFMESSVVYCFILKTPDVTIHTRVAEIGQYNLEMGNTGVMSTQPHSGVLLQSANEETWTPFQTEDMTFTGHGCSFLASETIVLGTTAVVDATDLNVIMGLQNYAGTTSRFFATLVDRNSERVDLNPNSATPIALYSGIITVSVELGTTDEKLTPILDGDINIAVGTVGFNKNYITRQYGLSGDNIKLYIDEYLPAGTTATISLQNGTDGGGDPIWVEMTKDALETSPLGDGWFNSLYTYTGLPVSETRIKINLNSSDIYKLKRPIIENLRSFTVL